MNIGTLISFIIIVIMVLLSIRLLYFFILYVSENMHKITIKSCLKILFVILVIYTVVTINILRIKQPELTETELFLKIPQSWIWNFNK